MTVTMTTGDITGTIPAIGAISPIIVYFIALHFL